jgi:2-(3-amino-3-carboxypropyl)histidine synthase
MGGHLNRGRCSGAVSPPPEYPEPQISSISVPASSTPWESAWLPGEVNVVNADRFLRKRHAIVEKSRDAPVFGIIVSRKPGQNRYALAQRLTSLGRTAFPIFMDEVSPAELLNLGFPAYVNTACPRLAYDDQILFPVPVLTSLEFEILCGLRSWDEYRMDEI